MSNLFDQGNGVVEHAEPTQELPEAIEQDAFISDELRKFQKFVSNCPKGSFVKTHKNVKYLEIRYLESLLDSVFPDWSFHSGKGEILLNSVVYTGTLELTNPVTLQTILRTGIGAVPIQTSSGKTSMEYEHILSGALQKGLPAAKAFAFKNAVQSLGALFGRYLNSDHYHFDLSEHINDMGKKASEGVEALANLQNKDA